MLACLLVVGQLSLREISERVAVRFPSSAPVTAPLGFPKEAAGMKRLAQGFYTAQLLPALLGKKTATYLTCGATEAAVARYGAEHVQVVRGKDEKAAECMLGADQGEAHATCEDGTLIAQRRGVSMATRLVDYIRVRGHEDVLGGGSEAFLLACTLAGGL